MLERPTANKVFP